MRDWDDLETRFWEKVKVGRIDECWLWLGARSKKGYGRIFTYGSKTQATHVLIFLSTGRWPAEGVVVMHHCDNPPCVNPFHIEEGSPSRNICDAYKRKYHNQDYHTTREIRQDATLRI